MTMHQAKQLVFTLSALLLSSSLSSANDISSCLEVECPTQEGNTSGNCQVANQTLTVIGVSSYSVPIPGQDKDLELTWTVGARSYDDVELEDGDRYIERVYYLGTPPSVDLKADDLAYDGCAFYLTGEENESLFHKTSAGSTPGSSSYCRQFLSNECVSSLNKKLSSLAEKQTLDSSRSRICPKIASSLQSDIPSSCDSLDDVIVRGVALTGPAAAEPLTKSQNSSSNCYPTLPKTNDLTRQFSYNISTTMDMKDTASAIEGETPILSMFWSNKGGNDSAIENAAVQLSCLRPIDKTTGSNDTKSEDGGDDGSNGAMPMNGGSNILGVAVAAGVAIPRKETTSTIRSKENIVKVTATAQFDSGVLGNLITTAGPYFYKVYPNQYRVSGPGATMDPKGRSLRGELVPLRTVQETQSHETTAEAYVAEIGIKSANSVLKVLDSTFPRDPTASTSHLRRFAKSNQLPNYLKRQGSPSQKASDASSPPQTIHVLIPPPLPDISTIQNLLSPYAPGDPTVEQASTSINIQSTHVLLQPPTSLERAEIFSKEFWPIIYNPAAHPAAHSPPPATLARTRQALEPEAGKYLALARRIAEEAKELGRGKPVGVVAVDPTLAKAENESSSDGNELRGVIAVAGDARYCGKSSQNFDASISPSNAFDPDQEGGPEKHALMRLIALIANKRLTETSQARSISTDSTTACLNQIPPLSPLESFFLHPPPPPTSQQESKDTMPDPSPGLLSSDNDVSVDTDANSSTGPYLCNSLDIYITHDPCACCSMGMVLSRFRAVVFIRNEARIGLGGLASTGASGSSGLAAGYGLNWRRELNWRVLGFEFVVEGYEEKREGEYREEKFNA